MNRFLQYLRNNHHRIFKVFLFVLTASVIVFLFPREGKFKYEFQKGKPWQHEDLIAPFDYPIHKSEDILEKERQEVIESSLDYFHQNQIIAEKNIKEFKEKFDDNWLQETSSLTEGEMNLLKEKTFYYQKGLSFLEEIYEKGIIELHSKIEGKKGDFEFVILQNNVANTVRLDEVYTIQEAFNEIENKLSTYKQLERKLLKSIVVDYLEINIFYDQETNDFILKQDLTKIPPTVGKILKGERVVSKGDLINEQRYKAIESLRLEYEAQFGDRETSWFMFFGQLFLVFLIISALALFLTSFRKEIIRSESKISFILLQIIIFVLAAKLVSDSASINLYLIPFFILPLVIRTFFDIRLALFTFLITTLLVGFFAPKPFEFLILQLVTGIITLFSIINLRKRAHLFLSSFLVFAIYSLIYISLELIQEASLEVINYQFLLWFFGSAMLTLFTYPLIYIFEKIFGFVSDVTLMELADTNSKLLRRLNAKAPGTFQHSLQVSNLAEEAIRAIGGNSLLVRTGALYHDIGKMNAPNYFIENQHSDYNPHDELSPEESAEIIKNHVIQGIEMARRFNLPDIIIDFIRTHHGTSKIRFFLKNYRDQNPEEEVDESKFMYPGPLPFSKETAVLMMADSVEAASRSLSTYDGETIEKLVDSIIENQIDEDQFFAADITFNDINRIKKIFKKKLMNIYHVRIEYPS